MKDIYEFIAKKEDSSDVLFNDWDLDQLATYVNEYTESKLNNNDVLGDVSLIVKGALIIVKDQITATIEKIDNNGKVWFYDPEGLLTSVSIKLVKPYSS